MMRVVEPDVVDQRRGARRRADAADAAALLLDVADQRMQPQLRQHHVVAECREPRAHGVAARLGRRASAARSAAPARRPCAPHRRGSSRRASGSAGRGTPRGRASPSRCCEAADRVVAQVLVIDGVVLQRVEQPDQVVRFRDEHAVGREHLEDAFDDRVHVLDMREAIGRGDDLGRRRACASPRAPPPA